MPKPLSILAVGPLPFVSCGTKRFYFGGSILATELFPRLARLGNTVRVLAEAPAARVGEERAGLPWQIPNLTVAWFALEYRRSAIIPEPAAIEAMKSRARPVFERFIRAQRPDVVMLSREGLVWSLLDLCSEYRLPVVLMVQGSPTAGFFSDAYPADARQRLLEHFSRCDRLITGAAYLENILRHYGVIQVRTILNIADPARFHPQPKDPLLLSALGIPSQHHVIGHVSTLKANKGPIDIVRSAEIVLQTNRQITYLIIGDGPCRQEMEDLGKAKGIAEHFRYVGETDHQDLPRYINLADLMVLPSKTHNVPPLLAYCETQACGCVVIASDVPAAREVIDNGETGVIARTDDPQDLAAKTLAIVQDATWRERIGQKARAVALQQTSEHWVQKYNSELYQYTSLVD